MNNNTLKSLSESTGFSISTISRVLSGKGKQYRIREATIELIMNEAAKHNYSPNPFAQSLRKEKTQTIGLIVPSLINSYFSNIAGVIIREAKKHQYRVIILDTTESLESEEEAINILVAQRVDGLLVVPCGEAPELLEKISQERTPVLLLDRYYATTSLTSLATDNYQGACIAIEHLVNHGHRQILCLQGIPFSSPNKERIAGYGDTLTKYGFENEIQIKGHDFSFQSGYIETKLALNRPDRPTAIFALSNTILLGAMKAIREAELRIPHDISIISFDNEDYLDLLDPPITRISQPATELGILAVNLLLEMQNGEEKASIKLPPSLIPGKSVKNLFVSMSEQRPD